MADFSQEKLDQSGSSKDDSSAITIEFLRARLLAERSVSKSARQRANELEKRVEELEEQLRVVSLQRKRAEKATVDVLSILESQGMSEASEAFDSGSDHETNRESEEGSGDERSSNVLKRRANSGSDNDSSSIGRGSLSWKGRTHSQWSREKERDQYMRKPRHAVSSIGSLSPKHHPGKSCRQIRRRDTRVVVERNSDPAKPDPQENGVSNQPNGVHNRLELTTENGGESSGSVRSERNVNNHIDVNGHEPVKNMEKALEDQAQLIDRYEEMEKAQREWEDKYRENNNSTPDSYDPGIQSDVTEEREVKPHTILNIGVDISKAEEVRAEQVNVPVEPPKPHQQANGFVPSLQVDINNSTIASTSQAQVFTFQAPKQNNSQVTPKNHHERSPRNFNHSPHFNNQSFERPSSETGSSSQNGDRSERKSQNDLYALVPHNPQNTELESVLDALKQAKLQLHQKMNRLPLEVSSGSVRKVAMRASERGPEISVGCAGLFRLPTNFAAEEEANNRARFIGSQIDRRSMMIAPDDRLLGSTRSVGSGPRTSYSETGLSSTNRYSNYSPQPSYPPFADAGFTRTFQINGEFYEDPRRRPNNEMYR